MRFPLLPIATLTFCIFWLNAPQPTRGAEGPQDTRTPSADEPTMLKRFVKECLLVTPGKGQFPAEATVGQPQPRPHERPRTETRMGAAFRISRYETTQELYAAVMGGNPSRWQGPRNSVERMTIASARQFCQRLTARLRAEKLISAQQIVRLPTDVEWEYCCRAGTKTRFHFGDEVGDAAETDRLDAVAWHTGNAAGNDPAVGVLQPNAWGLFDMHGYLWEFVVTPDNRDATKATIRGGSWRDRHPLLSSASYLTVPAAETGDHIGFRCVIAEKEAGKKATNQ